MRELLKKGYRTHITVVTNLYGAIGLVFLILYGACCWFRNTWELVAELIK